MSVGCCASEVLGSATTAEAGDGVPSDNIDTKETDELGIMAAPRNDQAGIRLSPPQKMTRSTEALKCIYEQEELEDAVQQENCEVVAITETWWNDTHNWSAAVNGNKPSEGAGQEGEVLKWPGMLRRVSLS